MAFPTTVLPIEVAFAFDGSTWTDVTSDARAESQIRISRGRSDWGQQVDAGRCSFSLSNTDGTYSPRNPEGPHFGQIGRNTPVRVSVYTGSVALDLPGGSGDYVSTPDAAALDIVGDLDVRLDATLVNWVLPDYPSSGQSTYERTELIGKTAASQLSWVLYARRSTLHFEWSSTGTNLGTATATADLPLTTSGRLAVRVTLDVDNGAGGKDITFYTSDSITGTWTQLGDTITGSGTTSVHSGTGDLRIGSITTESYDEAIGLVHAAQVRNGIGGTVVANPDFTAQTAGATSFADSAGRTWTVAGGAEITDRKTRFVGEVSSWTPEKNSDGTDVVCNVEASGVLRRLGIGAVPTKRPFAREFTSTGRRDAGVVAYWPMEDGAGATALASAFSGHRAIAITGGVIPAAYSDWVASAAIPTIDSGFMSVTVPSYTVASPAYGVVGVFVRVPAGGVLSTQRLMSFTTTGTARVWSLYVNTAGNLDLRAYDADGTQVYASGFGADSINGLEKYVLVGMEQSGADVDYGVPVVDIADSMSTTVPDGVSSAFQITGLVSGYTTGRITGVRFGEDAGMNETVLGHLFVGNASSSFAASAGVMVGWNAEEAASRVSRIGREESLHSYATGPGDEQCGTQPDGTALDIMHASEDVDEGILCELRTVLGLRYVTRASMYNQPVALTLGYTGSDGLVSPLAPTDDDQGITNDVTVSRTGGSSARVALGDGPLSTQAPPNGIGLYDTAYTLGLLDDEQPINHAGWRLHLGSWDETRFPQVTVNLAAAPASIEAAAAVDVGSRIQITDPPVWMPPDTLDLLVQGYSEVLDQFTWTLTYNCTPAGPWDVAWAGDDDTAMSAREFAWLDTGGSELAEDLTSTETTVDVLTTSGNVWTPYAMDTPFDWRVGGEVMTVTAPGNLQVTNTFFGTTVTGWGGASATIAHSTAIVHPHPGARGSMLVTPAGGVASVSGRSDLTAVGSIVPGQQYTISGWFYSPGGWSALYPSAQWADSAGNVFDSGGTSQAVTAGVWTYLESTVTAPATSSRARITARADGTPAASDVYYVWALRITRVNSSLAYDTFPTTVANGWGTAETGQAWTTNGGAASDYAVTSGTGRHICTSVNVFRHTILPTVTADADIVVDFTMSANPATDSNYVFLMARYTDTTHFYFVRVQVTPANAMLLTLRKRNGSESQIGSALTTSLTHAAGTWYRVRLAVIGTAVRAKLWPQASTEPAAWMLETTDSDLTGTGSTGVRTLLGTTSTVVLPLTVQFDAFQIINPQTYTVTRSVNGVVKTQSAGTAVALNRPAIIAL